MGEKPQRQRGEISSLSPGEASLLLSPSPGGPGSERGLHRRPGWEGTALNEVQGAFNPTQGEKEGELAPFT